MSEIVPELTEDMEVIGPGKMLAEARKKKSLSQQDVANRLNFRVSLVSDIESEQFDKSLPETYNRGYLKNYAKLVNISANDVLTSYEKLNIAETQGTEMLSFSKGTEKAAENNLLMWISYLILAVLVGLTIMWWLQDENRNVTLTTPQNQPTVVAVTTEQNPITNKPEQSSAGQSNAITAANVKEIEGVDESSGSATGEPLSELVADSGIEDSDNDANIVETGNSQVNENASPITNNNENNSVTDATTTAEPIPAGSVLDELTGEAVVDTPPVAVSFTFSGDCWVNIYDATGERIAWGIKRLGYVMNITGQAPFNITLGKPELVAIDFDGQVIDMSQFRVGQIAKFTLPITS